MNFHFSTQTFPERQRFDVYQEALQDAFFMPIDPRHGTAGREGTFRGEIAAAHIGPVRLSRVNSIDHRVVRTAAAARQDRDGYLLFDMLRAGSAVVRQDGREARIVPGDLVMFDTGRPFVWTFSGDFDLWVISVPRDLLGRDLGASEQLTARTVEGGAPMAGLVRQMLADALPLFSTLNGGVATRLSGALVQLLAATVLQIDDRAPLRNPTRARLLARVRQLVDTHLRDSDLSVARLARLAGISRSYLQSLFQEEGTTVGEFIRKQRLERCRWALADPVSSRRSVSEIAFEYGFNSLAHMSHRFKEAYAMSPSEYRIHALRQNAAAIAFGGQKPQVPGDDN